MFDFMGVIFCLFIQIIVYFMILSIIALIKKTTGKQIVFNNYHFFALLLIIPSIAIYVVLVAFLRGELEPINLNVSFSLDKISLLENPFDSYKKTIKLSWESDAYHYVLALVIIWAITLFCFLKIKLVKKDLTVKVAIFICSIFMSCNVPFIILDSKKVNNDNNTQKPAAIQSKYFCNQVLSPLGSSSFSAPIIGDCRTTQYYCDKTQEDSECKNKGW